MGLDQKIKLYRETALKAVDYQLRFQLPDGGYIWDGYVKNAFHKQGVSWTLAGRFSEAEKLMSWAKDKVQPDGQLKDYLGDVYKTTWFALSAQRIGRFDLSYPVASHLLSHRSHCGGFPRFAGDELDRDLTTAFVSILCLYFGKLDLAIESAEWCLSLLEQQPTQDKFYFHADHDGKLVTENDHEKAEFIDYTKPKQKYYELGVPMLFMCKLYQATGDAKYIDGAKKYFDAHFNCCKDSFAAVGSGKSALAAAIYYSITGDERGKDAACQWGDFIVDTQLPDGSWLDVETEADELYLYVDHAACFSIWLLDMVSAFEAKTAMDSSKCESNASALSI